MKHGSLTKLGSSFGRARKPATFTHQKKLVKNKVRLISIPNTQMRVLHRRLLDRLYTSVEVTSGDLFMGNLLESAYGSVRGRSALKNAKRHALNQYHYQVDISDAYRNVDLLRLAQILQELDSTLGKTLEIYQFLSKFCAGEQGGLAVGGPASPMLFNIFCAATIDVAVRAMCKGFTDYTRYLDDLTISSPRPIPRIFRRRIRDIIERAGFTINHRKSKVSNDERGAVTITGVVVTKNGELRPTTDFLKRLADMLRIPAKEMGQHRAAQFSGMAAHLFSFSKVDYLFFPFSDMHNVYARCSKKLYELRELGVLSKRTPKTGPQSSFSRAFIDDVKKRMPIEQVVRRYVHLEQQGSQLVALCPFHGDRTPSFKVVPSRGYYHCFGCGAHGDVIRLISEKENVSFQEALLRLARDAQISPNLG